MHLLASSEMPGSPQCLVRAFVGERCWKDFAGFHVQPDTIDQRPMNPPSDGGVQLADATQRQIDLYQLLMKRR